MSALSQALDGRLARMQGGLALEWPGGRAGPQGAPVRLRLRHRHLLLRLLRGQIGGLADAYVRGELDIDGALSDVMAVAAELAGDPVRSGTRLGWPRWLLQWHQTWRSRLMHRPERDAALVRFHYDACDDFYALWLDPLRVYSCAYFDPPDATLAQAQQAKLDLICRKLQLAPGQRFLDVGAGWGALLMWAAEHYGVQATGITLSVNQHAHVQRLIAGKGLAGRVSVRLCDYRELSSGEQYDRIASVGMFEHVGQAQMVDYFSRLRNLLRPGGLLLNHAIASGGPDNPTLGAGLSDFIEKHIFPGGELVHVSVAARGLALGGLEMLDAENLRPHYARTLWHWSDALESHLEHARALTDEATVRAYRLYLAGSAMSFERGWLALYQLLAARPDGNDGSDLPGARSDYPFNRRHMPA